MLQAGERVASPVGGEIGQVLRSIGRIQGEPLVRLPGELAAMGEELGMVTEGEFGPTLIPANLPHPKGPRDVKAMKAEQVRRMAAHPEQ